MDFPIGGVDPLLRGGTGMTPEQMGFPNGGVDPLLRRDYLFVMRRGGGGIR
jgi:hypothetical protein